MDVDVVKKIQVEYSKSDNLIVALDQHDNLHIAMHIGQGAYDSRPVERFVDEIRETVSELYQSGQFMTNIIDTFNLDTNGSYLCGFYSVSRVGI